ncbi:cytoplasmic polyadenylation element-binding protein 1-B isoform X2 [Ctenocephalides felis]|uniref:cytoplasmic polyadenylation element-binding protein 1-B isoform X2 n=1 Tax=Ctenocephalides felis TaxID=7515 RepID=UPI000E6E18A3|nr:cytoplasmic polyadenylation element-binding protein 1-B isoform X2 [Ctenocephalides felis]
MNLGSSYWNPDMVNSTEILQRQSINSLLSGGNAGHISPQEGDTLTVTELFGLNKPRSTTLSSSCGDVNPVGSPPKNYFNDGISTPVKTPQSGGWMDNSYSTPPRYGRSESIQSNQERSKHSWRYNNRNLHRRSSYTESLGSAAASPGTPVGLYGSPNSPLDAAFGRSVNLLDLLLQEQNLLRTPSVAFAEYTALDRAARFHRSGASLYDATCTWSGVLPKRSSKITGYSSKVFLGGVPWDITEQMLVAAFQHIGPIKVEWPGKEKHALQPKGFAYIVFENEKHVRHLLSECTTGYGDKADDNCLYYKISSKRMKSKQVQVIPWILNDTNFSRTPSQKLDGSKTIFVGALHGLLNAEGLAKIMNDLFEGVIYAGLDTDKYKYPIGSGRVAFSNHRSYMKAITAAFIDIKTEKFSKKVQLDPYLEDSLCSLCGVQQGPYFCRELVCFRYFCRTCWQMNHINMVSHKPLMRNSKSPIIGMSFANTSSN